MLRFPVIVSILVLFSLSVTCDGYKILAFFPFPAKSHHKVWDPLLKELAVRGHQVTALKSFKMDDPPEKNYEEILAADILQEVIKLFGGEKSFSRPTFIGKLMMAAFFKSSGLLMGQLWMKDPGVQTILNSNTTYDAVIFESAFMQEFVTTLQHKFNAVGIEVSTAGNMHWLYWMYGNPVDTSYVVDAGCSESTDRMTFLERLHLTAFSAFFRCLWHVGYMPKFQKFMDDNIKYPGWETRPSMLDMIANTSIVLVNSDIALTYPHAMSPNFIEIGGINVLPNKPLPKDLQEFMDGADDGVIFFTLGSHIQVSSVLGNALRDIFSNVFSRLKQRVLWKWEDKSFVNIPPNVKISKWFPQQDILAHKNMKLFISHGGFLSITEAIHFGIPVVGIPIFADQDKNINFLKDRGLGVHLALDNITEVSVNWAVQEIISQPKYKENAVKQSRILRDKPMTPLNKAVFWTEYVIRHKGAHHLKPAIVTMPWYQQALIDVYLTLAIIVLIPLYIFYRILKCIRTCLCGASKNSKRKKD